MKKYTKLLFVGIIIACIIGAFMYARWDQKSTYEGKREPKETLTVGYQVSPAMALVMIAKDQGYYEQQGLEVELKEFTAGKFALQAFFGGSLDVAISGDVPVALSTLQGNMTSVVGQVVEKTTNEVRIVVRKDNTSRDAKTYFSSKKRKVGTSFGGGPEFFTYEFMNDLKIGENQIELISQTPADMPAALLSGSVDAISIFDPFAFKAEKLLGDQAVTFKNQDIYSELYVINVQPRVKEKNEAQKKVESFLRALIEAEKFTAEHPNEAKIIVMKYTKLDQETVDTIWSSFSFKTVLTPQLLKYWEREAEWAKATNKVKKNTPTPDFRNIIFESPLKNISPERVEI